MAMVITIPIVNVTISLIGILAPFLFLTIENILNAGMAPAFASLGWDVHLIESLGDGFTPKASAI